MSIKALSDCISIAFATLKFANVLILTILRLLIDHRCLDCIDAGSRGQLLVLIPNLGDLQECVHPIAL